MTILEWALTYATAAGYGVLPAHTIRNGICSCGGTNDCVPGQHLVEALVPRGLRDATTDPDVIKTWLSKMPDANVAIATGRESDLVVLAINDNDVGAVTSRFGSLPYTARVKTDKGCQWHFTYPKGAIKVTSGARENPNLHVSGDDSYVVVPPSVVDASGPLVFVDSNVQFLPECPPLLVAFANNELFPSQIATPSNSDREPSQKEKLISIGLEADLWHDTDGNTSATVQTDQHQESFALKGFAFNHWLTRQYGERNPFRLDGKTCPSAPGAQSLKEAINALSAKAAKGPERQAAVRVAAHGNLIYIDLGTSDWTAVEISPSGWQTTTNPPVCFIRPAGFKPLPVPIKGGNIAELGSFLNLASAPDFILIVSWLIAALRPKGPYVVLIINGEQGSGKTIICRILRRLVDPNTAELRSDTKNERDLLLAAKNGWIVALDNLSYVRNDLSDAICRIATKGAFATRSLYTNDEEFLLEVCRPVLLNGIPPLASRADLADRAIVCTLPPMKEARRRSEDEFWSAFETAAPRILGALLDGVSGALRNNASIEFSRPPRMMDFAKWSEAAWQALGLPVGTFEAAYSANRSSTTDEAIEADPLAGAVIDFMNTKRNFTGTATELLTALDPDGVTAHRDRRWPRDATRLSSHLRRLPPLLRQHGIEILFSRARDAARKRIIEIKKVGPK